MQYPVCIPGYMYRVLTSQRLQIVIVLIIIVIIIIKYRYRVIGYPDYRAIILILIK